MTSIADQYRLEFRTRDSLQRFLDSHEVSEEELKELLLADQYLCWKSKEPRPIADYAKWLNSVGDPDSIWMELAEEEYGYFCDHSESDPSAFQDHCRGLPTTIKHHMERLSGEESTAGLATLLEQDNPKTIGRYQVLSLLGSGQFGQVYLAEDPQLQRQVAIKVPTAAAIHQAGGDEAVIREARLVAGIDHPGIVPVFDAGRCEDGRVYIVSKFINGENLASRISRSPIASSDAIAIVVRIARALQAAHVKGVVHRDVKPANIMLDEEGAPKLVDFGLALLDEDPRSNHLAGSPAYMSPEQARGEGHRVDARSDIYSLGTILYELFTGKHAHAGRTVEEVLERVRNSEVKPPRLRQPNLPRELDRICMRALASRVYDRYRTAEDLAEDLENFQKKHRSSATVHQPSPEAALTVQLPQGPIAETVSSDSVAPNVIPKGLRAFEKEDAEFFMDLLPGPRDSLGKPAIIREWKQKLESSRPSPESAVNIIYGPSGCGKSSLVRAGILPQLDERLPVVVVNARPEGLETELLQQLQKAQPHLQESQLAHALSQLRREEDSSPTLVVIDQFEQWLQSWRGNPDEELIGAIRQTDGWRLRVLLLVRDDYWMATTRLMRELDLRIQEGVNATSVDMFTEHHAQKVMLAFGEAYGVINSSKPSKENEAFLSLAIDELSDRGKILPVCLSLFVQMVHARPWTPITLKQLGGIEGVGLTFLEETFGDLAPARYRIHAQAVQQLLARLAPSSSVIRGKAVSKGELLDASGYSDRREDFEEILEFLDKELRLITMVENPDLSEPHYQLSHDYLVPSIGQWLEQKRSTTWRGRSELELEIRTELWQRRSEWRSLPSPLAFLGIRWLTDRVRWTPAQQQMMRVAGRTYFWATALVVLIAFSGTWMINELVGRSKAKELHAVLLSSELSELSDLSPEIRRWNTWIQPLIARSITSDNITSEAKRNLALAILDSSPSQMDFIVDEALHCDHESFFHFAALLPHGIHEFSPQNEARLSSILETRMVQTQGIARVRTAALIQSYGSEVAKLECNSLADSIVDDLLSSPGFVAQYLPRLMPMRQELCGAAIKRFHSTDESKRELAAIIVRDCFSGTDSDLVGLLASADPKQFVALMELGKGRETLLPILEESSSKQFFPPWDDVREQPAISENLNLKFANASGWIEANFAVCQTLPYGDVHSVVEELAATGYRLIKLRPYQADHQLRIAAVWYRDHRKWDWAIGLTRNELQEAINQKNGELLAQDVAGYLLPKHAHNLSAPGDDESTKRSDAPANSSSENEPLNHLEDITRFAFVWSEAAFSGEKRESFFGLPTKKTAPKQQMYRNFGYRELARHLFTDPSRKFLQHSMIWGLDASHLNGSTYDVLTEKSIVPFNVSFEAAVDLCVVPVDDERCDVFYGGIWLTEDRSYDHETLIQLDIETHLERMRDLAKQGYRPSSLSVAQPAPKEFQSCSVWLRPKPTIEQNRGYAVQKSNLACALVWLGKSEALLSTLEENADPIIRAQVIHALSERQIPLERIIDLYSTTASQEVRSGLLLALGAYDRADFESLGRWESMRTLVELAAESPKAALRSAACWCRERWQVPSKTDFEPEATTQEHKPEWFVTQNRHEMRIIDTTAQENPFELGSYPSEPGTSWDERKHLKWIKRRFAVSVKETTVAQFRNFVEAENSTLYAFRGDEQSAAPVTRVSWLLAAEYCNWLSKEAKLPKDQWCYEIQIDPELGPQLSLAQDYLEREGFRLPTEAEWEYCCRAGTATARPFGDSQDLLNEYSWFATNSESTPQKVGLKRPNQFGFFDMLGNAREWCMENWRGELTRLNTIANNDHEDSLIVSPSKARVTKGGSFAEQPIKLRSANRIGIHSNLRLESVGFRVAQTLPNSPAQ